MSIKDYKIDCLPSCHIDKNPKFLFVVDNRIPEHVFQHGLELNSLEEFNFFEYYFNSFLRENKSKNFINAYDTIQEAIINFRKDILLENIDTKDLYLYVIRPDQKFYNKDVTRFSIPSSILEKRIITNSKEESEKIIFSLSYLGQYFSNPNEWFTTEKIKTEQIFSATQIKIDFKKINNSKKNRDIIATPNIVNLEFRNPNYIESTTFANEKPFIFPEEKALQKMNFCNDAFVFGEIYSLDISKQKEPYLKSFRCENLLSDIPDEFIKNKWVDKKPKSIKMFYWINGNKKQEVVMNYYRLLLDDIFSFHNLKEFKLHNYLIKQKKMNLIFTYEKHSSKSVYLKTRNSKKKSNICFELKSKKSKKNISDFVFDKYGRFILNFNNLNPLPYALTIKKVENKYKDLFEIDVAPAIINDDKQQFYLEYAYGGIFYLKSKNQECNNLELAIKHQNNSFVFLNPKKKYNFAYDLVNINIFKYPIKDQSFIYGWESFCPEFINLNLSWKWNSNFYKPNVFVSVNKNKDPTIEQARSSVIKTDNINILYNINSMKIIYVDYYMGHKHENKCYTMINKADGTNKYRWLEWRRDNISNFGNKQEKWLLKKYRYSNDNYYWIISYLNNDYLWVQQKGENWGFFFLAKKDSNPQKSSPLFSLNINPIK